MNYKSHFLVVAGLCMSFVAHAQGPAPLATPNLQLHHAGYVTASAVLPDGSVIVGGTFQSFDGVPRMRLAKFQASGELDPGWAPQIGTAADSNASISAIAIDSAGNIYIGGIFASVNGVPRSNLAKLLPNGTLDNVWTPAVDGEASSAVGALALDGNGNLFVGGTFTVVGGQTRANLAKLSTSGTGVVDASWNPSPDNHVGVLASDINGSVYVGGSFTSIGGQSRSGLAKLSTSGTGVADANWNPAPTGSSLSVASIDLDGHGNLFVAGRFTAIGGQSRNGIAKLSTSGTGVADANWDPSPTGPYAAVYSLALDGSGNVYVGGFFTGIGGQTLLNIAKLSSSGVGGADPGWAPSADFDVYSLATDNGTVYAGGTFLKVGGVQHLGFAQIDSSGMVRNSTPDAEVPGQVVAILPTPDGGMIVGGYFLKANGEARKNLLRVRPDGTLDSNWNVPADQFVTALAQDSTGDVYVGGIFDNIGGQARAYLAKLSITGAGSVDPTWNPGADGQITALVADGIGNLYVGGYFTQIAGQACTGLARLSVAGIGAFDSAWSNSCGYDYPTALALDGNGMLYSGGYYYGIKRYDTSGDGSADSGWSAVPDQPVSALALDGNGSVYVGGWFLHIGAVARNHIAKLSTSTGVVDASWNPDADNGVSALAVDALGNVYAGGYFSNIGGQPRNAIARLSDEGTGTADPAWNPSPDSEVRVLAQDGTGRLYIGGSFVSIGSQSRGGLAAFAGDPVFSNGFE